MKAFFVLLAGALIILSSCSTQYQARNYDDVYYSPKNAVVEKDIVVVKNNSEPEVRISDNAAAPEPEYYAESDQQTEYYTPTEDSAYVGYSDETGNTYVTNNFYSDDYYDYEYSSRLRRFHSGSYYNNYYHDYYTNSYWYDYDPYNYGISIYMGYNWWYPSYHYPRYSWYNSYYSPYNRWGWYDPWYYDYYNPYGYGWGGYYNGYWNGYYDGYWCGAWSNYYNSHDKNSNHYGHRGSVGNSGSLTGHRPGTSSLAERYEASVNGRRNDAVNEGHRVVDPTSLNGRRTNEDNNQRPAVGTTTGRTQQRPAATTTRTDRQYRYTNPNSSERPRSNGTVTPRTSRPAQTYNSPNSARPRTGNEYTTPKYRAPQGNVNPGTTRSNENRPAVSHRSNSGNNQQGTPRVNPSGENRQRVNPVPSGRTENRVQPSKPQKNESSQPARSSGNNYSQPSRSSAPSYTPSRSSSSSSGSSSSGSSSSGSSSGGSSRSSGSSSGSGGGSSSGSGGGHRR